MQCNWIILDGQVHFHLKLKSNQIVIKIVHHVQNLIQLFSIEKIGINHNKFKCSLLNNSCCNYIITANGCISGEYNCVNIPQDFLVYAFDRTIEYNCKCKKLCEAWKIFINRQKYSNLR